MPVGIFSELGGNKKEIWNPRNRISGKPIHFGKVTRILQPWSGKSRSNMQKSSLWFHRQPDYATGTHQQPCINRSQCSWAALFLVFALVLRLFYCQEYVVGVSPRAAHTLLSISPHWQGSKSLLCIFSFSYSLWTLRASLVLAQTDYKWPLVSAYTLSLSLVVVVLPAYESL